MAVKSKRFFGKPKEVNPSVKNNPNKIDLRRAARRWIKGHPRAMKLFLKFARDMVFQRRMFGIGLLTERVRWQYKIEGKRANDYKINNNHRAYIARWLIEKDKKIEPFIEFREVRY
jgi:hypothetical protein